MRTALFCLCFVSWRTHDAFPLKTSEVAQVVATNKGKALLTCSVPKGSNSTVSWIAPSGERVASGNKVLSEFKNMAGLSADGSLLIKFAVFPDHVGVWTCAVGPPILKIFSTNLTLLVPPPDMKPSISAMDTLHSDRSRVYVITCTGHYALPAVTLAWKRKSGRDVEFDTSAPRYIRARSGLSSVRLELVLTDEHGGSTFECSSRHQTSPRDSISSFRFILPSGIRDKSYHMQKIQMNRGHASLTPSDKSFLFIFVTFIILYFMVAFLLYKFKSRWKWRGACDDARQTLVNNDRPQNKTINSSTQTKNSRKKILRNKATFCLQTFLLLMLVVTPSLYHKGLEVPTMPGVDRVVAVFAGSALWLDCRGLFHGDNLIKIKWSFNGECFYHQYNDNQKYTGHPQNGSVGLSKGFRVTSVGTGQITLWPVVPDQDEGLYACEVLLLDQESRRMVTMVNVLSKPSANPALIGLLVLSIMCATSVVILLFCNSIKMLPLTGKSKNKG